MRKIIDSKKIADLEKKRIRKKADKKVKRFFRLILAGLALFCTGYFLGMHHKLLKAIIKKEKLNKTKNDCPFFQ